jgi:vacuolar protein sorting-associated protein 13A/C
MGSLNMFGNPVGLFRSIKKGLVEFVEKPAEGFGKGPLDGGLGIAEGTTALVRNTMGGGFNTIDKITGSLGDGFAALTFVRIKASLFRKELKILNGAGAPFLYRF